MKIITTITQFKRIQSWNADWLPEGYAQLDDSLDLTQFYQCNGCVDVTITNGVVTGISPNTTAWNTWNDTQPNQTTLEAEEARIQRDKLLTACDWTQMADSPLDADTKVAWATYRQALRDVTLQENFPTEIIWPVEPT